MYTQYYGLRAQPFRLTPDPYYFFSSATHKSALAYMHYGMQQGEGFIVVTGSPGTGKTTLALTLVGKLPRNTMVIGELVTTQLQPEDLLRAIAAVYDLNVEGTKSDLIVRLQEFFTARVRAGKRVLLLVDEAHDLPKTSFEELRMLSNFHNGPQALLQCILLGQPPLRDLLTQTNMDQFQQRVIAAHNLLPLSLQETRDYILHRLQQAGWHGDPSFTAEAIKLIHQYTQGIPRRINALCTRLMLYGYIQEKHQVDATATNQVYSEWDQELSQADPAESLRQHQVVEIGFSGLTQEDVTVGHAVGADTNPVRVSPVTRLNQQRNVTTPFTHSDKRANTSKPPKREATPQSIFIEQVSRPSYAVMADNSPRSTTHSLPRSRIPWILPALAVLATVMVVVVYLPGKNLDSKLNPGITKIESHIQTAFAPIIPSPSAPIAIQSKLPADKGLHPVDAGPKEEATPDPATKESSSPPTTPAMKVIKPIITESNQVFSNKHGPKLAMSKTEFAAMDAQPDSLPPTEPAPAIPTKQDSQPTTTKTKITTATPLSEAKSHPEPVTHDVPAKHDPHISKTRIKTVSPPRQNSSKPVPAAQTDTMTVAKHPKAKDQRSTLKSSVASVSVAYANPQHQTIAPHTQTNPVPSKTKVIAKAMPISQDELNTLLSRFREAYNSGNINALAQLFANNAHSDEDDSRDAIIRSYHKLFNLTADRNLTLTDLHWQSAGQAAQGEGRFGIKIKERGRDWKSSYSGKIKLSIEKRDGQVLITALNYSYTQ